MTGNRVWGDTPPPPACPDACCDLAAARLLLQKIRDWIGYYGVIYANDRIVTELKNVTR